MQQIFVKLLFCSWCWGYSNEWDKVPAYHQRTCILVGEIIKNKHLRHTLQCPLEVSSMNKNNRIRVSDSSIEWSENPSLRTSHWEQIGSNTGDSVLSEIISLSFLLTTPETFTVALGSHCSPPLDTSAQEWTYSLFGTSSTAKSLNKILQN